MSSDAKVWQEDDGGWQGLHDGLCKPGVLSHETDAYGLRELLEEIEACSRVKRWEFRVYPDGKAGLVGWSF